MNNNDFFTFFRILIYFCSKHKYFLFRTKVYKLIFLTELIYSSLYKERLFKGNFTKTLYHIKLDCIDDFINILNNNNIIKLTQLKTSVIIDSKVIPNKTLYSKKELKVLNLICKNYSCKSSKDLEEEIELFTTIPVGSIINFECQEFET